jgi:hypothetical protein
MMLKFFINNFFRKIMEFKILFLNIFIIYNIYSSNQPKNPYKKSTSLDDKLFKQNSKITGYLINKNEKNDKARLPRDFRIEKNKNNDKKIVKDLTPYPQDRFQNTENNSIFPKKSKHA